MKCLFDVEEGGQYRDRNQSLTISISTKYELQSIILKNSNDFNLHMIAFIIELKLSGLCGFKNQTLNGEHARRVGLNTTNHNYD